MALNKTIAALLMTLLATSVPEAKSAPFRFTPNSFAHWLNSKSWSDGSKVYFSNLHSCSYKQNNVIGVIGPSNPWHAKWKELERLDTQKRYSDEWLQMGDAGRAAWIQQIEEAKAYIRAKTIEFANQGPKLEHYSCRGYVRIADPRGTRTCQTFVKWDEEHGFDWSLSGCKWQ